MLIKRGERSVTRTLPHPALKRLSTIYQFLCRLEDAGQQSVSSKEIGDRLDISAHSVRKDISYLGQAQISGAKYGVSRLKDLIAESLDFKQQRKACVIGLGKMGSAILNYNMFDHHGFTIVAGFDSNVNKVETLQSSAKLYPSYMISDIINSEKIELAILCVTADAAQLCTDRLVEGGIKGIVNITSTLIQTPKAVVVSDIDVTRELRILSAMVSLQNNNPSN